MRYMTLLERCYNKPVLIGLEATSDGCGEGAGFPISGLRAGQGSPWIQSGMGCVKPPAKGAAKAIRYDSDVDPIENAAVDVSVAQSVRYALPGSGDRFIYTSG